jgi:class 3 adenylate cyclase/tetratricopeptide (TPR) repeat protein
MTCPSCQATNEDGARFCASCGASLALACSSCGAALPDEARFCPSCGAPVAPVDDGQRTQERRIVTLLFADLSGSTALGERLDPERLRQVLDRYFAAMRVEIEAEGGTVEKFIGDAVVAGFGTPVAHEDDAARALRAALRMQSRLPSLNEELEAAFGVTLEVRIGVNTGEVLATVDPEPGEPMFTGDAVNTAARFEQHAEPGQVLASERTVRAARGFVVTDAGAIEMKGKAAPVQTYVVLREDEAAAARGVPGLSAPMVGREAELALLDSTLARSAIERRPHLVTIYGDPGVGKSRLVQEFLSAAEADDRRTIVRGRCLPYGDGVTYWPLAEILKGVAGVKDSDPPGAALERVQAAGAGLLGDDPAAARATAALAFTMGLDDPAQRFDELDPKQVREEIGAAWRGFFAALAREAPVLALVEDIHWADPALLDLLEQFAEWVDAPVLFLCPARPELLASRPTWGGGKRNYSAIALDPLTADESEDLIRALLDIDDLPSDVHRRILEQAGGNPFFLEEIVRRLVDGGHVVQDGDRWRATGDIETVEIPDTVQAVLAARIDLLEPASRSALQAAAVVGRIFWPGAVGRLVSGNDAGLDEALVPLLARDLVRRRPTSVLAGETEFSFKHVLTRDVAYETLPRTERATAHAAVAAWLEDTVGERRGEFVELLAHHTVQAYRTGRETAVTTVDLPTLREQAFDLSLQAARAARTRNALYRVERFAHQALDLADGPAERSLAAESLAIGYFDAYRGTDAWDAFLVAIDEALAVPKPDGRRIAELCGRAAAVATRWQGSMRGGATDAEVTRVVSIGMAHLPAGDSRERVELLAIRSSWPFAFPSIETDDDRVLAYEADGLEAAETALRLGLPDLASAALDAAAGPAMALGDYARTLDIERRRIELLDRLRDPLEIGDTFAMMCWALVSLGRYEEAEGYAARGLALDRSPSTAVHLFSWLVDARFRLGAWDAALSAFDEFMELLEEQRDDPPNFVAHAYVAAATIQQLRGERAEAERLASIVSRLGHFASGGGNSLRSWTSEMSLLAARGDLGVVQGRVDERIPGWKTHAVAFFEGAGAWAAEAHAWDRAPHLVEEMRTFASGTGCRPIVWEADLLEGRWHAGTGDAEAVVVAFTRGRAGYEDGRAARMMAVCDLEVAAARGVDRLDPEERHRFDEAIATFERLRSVADLDRVRALTS